MPKSANQRLVDALVRHQAFLVGHAKELADRLGKKLDETTPEMRKHLLETFASNDQSLSAKRLRATEARLHGMRMPQWDAVREMLIGSIAELVSYEPEFLGSLIRRIRDDLLRPAWSSPPAEALRRIIERGYVAGHTIVEHIASMARNDLVRISGATRIGVLARETAQQIAARVLGNARALSPVLRAAARALDTLVTSAVHAFSSSALELAAKQNSGQFSQFDLWVSVLDEVTTDGCRKLHLSILPRGEGIRPGYHYHCRSSRVPIIDEDDKPGNLESFATWMATQGSKFKSFLKGMKVFSRAGVSPLSLDDVKRWDEDTFE